MSLLDALQAAGAIDKKAAAKAKRAAKSARKKERGNLEKKKVIEAKAEEEEEELQRERSDQRRTERLERQVKATVEDAQLTGSNLIRAWSISFSVAFATTSFRFQNLAGEPETVQLPEFLIERVRLGSLGLARIGSDGDVAVLPKGAMAKLYDALPSAVLYLASAPK
jgi:uncharacterized protein YaiL (DUF2058 family)